jgi:alkylation response protein AidB-like acyl-CoA dehydrogenase
MDVALTETQTLLRDTLREYLRNEVPMDRIRSLEREGGFDRDLWSYLQSAGYLGLPFPEEMGGGGGELTDLAVVVEELARRAAMVPFVETLVSALAIQRHGDASTAAEVVNEVIEGRMTIAPAVAGDKNAFAGPGLEVKNGKITGTIHCVDYGNVASHFLVAGDEAGAAGLYLVVADSPSVSRQDLVNIGRTPQTHVTFRSAPARRVAGEEGLRFLGNAARALCSIQCLGNAAQALDMTVNYVSNRVQFGQPLATFQAVQHHCANMAIMVEAAQFLSYEAVWKVDRGLASAKDVAVAKAWASKTATEVPMQAHQLHGGMGITEEYGLHFFSRRGKERALAWGSSEECLRFLSQDIEEQEAWL